MGVPPEIEFGDDCLLCYPANETPKHMWLSFTGIQIGAMWAPWMAHPPNGVWEVVQVAPCFWSQFYGFLNFQYVHFDGVTDIICLHAAASSPFDSGHLAQCSVFANSIHAAPAGKAFWGGKCEVSFKD